MVKIAIDPDSGQIINYWPDGPEEDALPPVPGLENTSAAKREPKGLPGEAEGPRTGLPVLDEGLELVELDERTEEFERQAREKAGGPPGRMWMKGARGNRTLEAEPSESVPVDVLDELMDARPGKRASEPVTWADVSAAAQRREGRDERRGRGRSGRGGPGRGREG